MKLKRTQRVFRGQCVSRENSSIVGERKCEGIKKSEGIRRLCLLSRGARTLRYCCVHKMETADLPWMI